MVPMGMTRDEETRRRTMTLFEADCCVITNIDKWPEYTILENWAAIVDAESDLICLVPPYISQYSNVPMASAADLQSDTKMRAQVICDALNAAQNEKR